MRLALTIGLVLLAGVTGMLGFVLGQQPSEPRIEHDVRCVSAPGAISCELEDGWTVGVPQDVGWTDEKGVDHEGDRPECLPPSGGRLEAPLSLAWVPVDLDGMSWRVVVFVYC